MKKHAFIALATTLLSLVSLAITSHADGSKIYKVTDKNGKVFYTNTTPKDLDKASTAEEIEQQESNVFTSQDNDELYDTSFFKKQRDRRASKKDIADAHKARMNKNQNSIQQLQEAYEASQVLRAGDYTRNKNGGLRKNQQYHDRVNAAKEALMRGKAKASKQPYTQHLSTLAHTYNAHQYCAN